MNEYKNFNYKDIIVSFNELSDYKKFLIIKTYIFEYDQSILNDTVVDKIIKEDMYNLSMTLLSTLLIYVKPTDFWNFVKNKRRSIIISEILKD